MAKVPALVDRYGRPIERQKLTQEIAGPTLSGVRSPISGYPGDGLNPLRLARILREADEGEPLRFFELAEQIEERDLHYAGVLGTRKRSVAQIDISVDAATDAAEHVRQADRVRAWLLRDELQDELFDILDAIGKGMSIVEIMWDTSGGQWMPQRLEWRDPRWFRYDRADGRTPRIRVETGDQELAPFKFIIATLRAKSGLPVRSGLARLAAWAWMFKAFTQRDWAIFTQTYGQPIRIGKYGPGATEADKDTLFRAVANVAGDCAAIIPESMLIDFIESKNVGPGSDLYEKRSDWLDRQISKAVLGQTGSTDAIAGGYAVGKVHRSVQEDIERADSKSLSAVLNRDLVRPWIDLEYGPPADGLYPRLKIGRPEERDVKMIVEAVSKLVPMGMEVQASAMRDMLGIPDPDDASDLLMAPAAAVPPEEEDEEDGPSRRPAAAPQDEKRRKALQAARPLRAGGDVVDELARQAEDLAEPATGRLIDHIRELVMEVSSLDELRDRLIAIAPDMPTADLAAALGQAMAMAELLGRSEIAGGASRDG